jgi:hypothetical protein
MKKLASISVWAEPGLVKLDARLGLKIRWHMLLLDQFMGPVGEGTRIAEFTGASELPIPAHLCLYLGLVLLDELISITLRSKDLLRASNGCHFLSCLFE